VVNLAFFRYSLKGLPYVVISLPYKFLNSPEISLYNIGAVSTPNEFSSP
jgi:hypothetical protein